MLKQKDNDIFSITSQGKFIGLEINKTNQLIAVSCRIGQKDLRFNIKNDWYIVKNGIDSVVKDCMVKNMNTYELPYPRIGWTEDCDGGGFTIDYSVEIGNTKSGCISFSAIIACSEEKGISLKWTQRIQGIPSFTELFAPTEKGFFDLSVENVCLSYRGRIKSLDGICMPLVTLIDKQEDMGFSIAGHMETPILPFRFKTESKNVCALVERDTLVIKPGNAASLRQYYIFHEGCWRPGLGWARERFPELFMLPDDKMSENHGCFSYSRIAGKELCRYMAGEGVKYLEIHFTYPHLGKYVPDSEPWITAVDDKWSAVKHTTDPESPPEDSTSDVITDYIKNYIKAAGTVDGVRKFIKDLKEVGISSFCYFQPTECWEFYANAYFPDSILYNDDGTPKLTWYDHVQMDCKPGTRWGEYLCRQMEMLLDMYPELDGIFMDQAAEDWVWDDYAVCGIVSRLAKIAKSRGKYCFWNGPYQVELIEHAIGMLAEGGSSGAELIKFLTIGNKICCGMGGTEPQYQRNLINGLWPSVPSHEIMANNFYSDEPLALKSLPDERRELHDRYMPLYELYKGKKWVLEPHAVGIPDGMEGNIFERPNGDYIIPLIIAGRNCRDGIFQNNSAVVVRVSGTDRVKGVYVRTPDIAGQYALPWEREGNVINITLPWFGSACVIWLAGEEQKSDEPGFIQRRDAIVKKSKENIMSAYIQFDGVFPEGSKHGINGGMKTTAPLRPIPERKVWFNGHEALLTVRNHRNWHPLMIIGLGRDILDYLKEENEIIIEPDNPRDFFKLRNLKLQVVLASSQVIKGETPRHEVYSSCVHPLSEGVIGSPVKIMLRVPGYKKI